MQRLRNLATDHWFSLIAAFAPILILLWLVYTHAVLLPYWDQWELVPLIRHIREDGPVWHDFWVQHNEHRLLVPRAIMVVAAYATQWNTITEMLISIALAVVSFGLLIMVMQQSDPKLFRRPVSGLYFILSLIWFSTVQYENWLWGWQIQWFLSNAAVMCVVFAIAKLVKDTTNTKPLCIALTGGVVAQYSLGNGALVWPLLLVALWYVKCSRRIIGITGLVALVSTGLYYIGYRSVQVQPSTADMNVPVEFVLYFFAYLGRPLTYNPQLAALSGLVMTCIFSFGLSFLYFKHPNRLKKSLPWVFLGIFVMASAAATALSRLGFGAVTALTSRYSTVSSLLLVSVVMLVYAQRDLLRLHLGAWYPRAAIGVCVLLGALLGLNYVNGLQAMKDQKQKLLSIKNCTSQSVPTADCLMRAYPDEVLARERLEYLKSIQWGGY